ncbi:MAG: hypothetical protein ACI9ON_001305 [Limisphaerales bacterium]|jgi:hypothetical protein
MENLVGKCFTIDESQYLVVDVRNIDGEVMVYAEPPQTKGPGRAAFRLTDIALKLNESVA